MLIETATSWNNNMIVLIMELATWFLHYFQHKWPVNPIIDFVKTQIKKNWILAWLLGLLHRFMRDKNVIQDESKLKKNKIGRYLFT